MMMWYFTVCMGWCCPCILGWMIAKKLGENPLFYCLGMYVMPVLPLMRQRTREKYGITVRIWLFRFPNHNFWIFKLWSKRRKIEKKKTYRLVPNFSFHFKHILMWSDFERGARKMTKFYSHFSKAIWSIFQFDGFLWQKFGGKFCIKIISLIFPLFFA